MEPSPAWGRCLVEVHVSFRGARGQRGRDVEPTVAVGPGGPYSLCQGLDSCVDETCQQFYSRELIAKVPSTAVREYEQAFLDEVAGVVRVSVWWPPRASLGLDERRIWPGIARACLDQRSIRSRLPGRGRPMCCSDGGKAEPAGG